MIKTMTFNNKWECYSYYKDNEGKITLQNPFNRQQSRSIYKVTLLNKVSNKQYVSMVMSNNYNFSKFRRIGDKK